VEALDLGSALVVGHSLGGAVMLRAMLDYPGVARAGVNIAGSASSADAKIGYSDELLRLVSLNPTDWMETIFYSVIRSAHLTTEQRWELAFDPRRVPPECLAGDLRAYTSCAFLGELSAVNVPVLSIAGEYDWTCAPERVENTSANLPRGQYELFEGVGHMPHLEVPERLCARLLSFFECCQREVP
jgi:sigma-B regulation protein RsbQ